MTITLRATKGSALTHTELDSNFTDLQAADSNHAALTEAHGSNGNIIGTTQFFRGIVGLDPEKVTTNLLRLYPGACGNSNGTDVIGTSTSVDIDLSTTGANGLDTGTVTNGVDYHVYVLKKDSDGTMSAVVSDSITYGGVTVPTGYTLFRKLPFGFVYHSTNWDGIPAFHLSAWPKPFIRLTDSEEGSAWRALNSGTATTFTNIDLTPWLPDNARMAYIFCRVSATGTNGMAQVRVSGAQTFGLTVGSAIAGAENKYLTLHQRVTSTRDFQYKVTGGASLSVFVLGYWMTEPS